MFWLVSHIGIKHFCLALVGTYISKKCWLTGWCVCVYVCSIDLTSELQIGQTASAETSLIL